jgi:hypothetical protein
MQQYKAYPKQAIVAVMNRRLRGDDQAATPAPTSTPSLLDFTKWPQYWEQGAKELEKTGVGKVITAPIRLPESLVTSTEQTVAAVPGIVANVSKVIPILAVGAVLIGGGFLWYKFSKRKNVSMSGEGKRMIIKVEPVDGGFVSVASDGNLPFEGRVHPTIDAAMRDLNAAYNNKTWRGVRRGATKYSIMIS